MHRPIALIAAIFVSTTWLFLIYSALDPNEVDNEIQTLRRVLGSPPSAVEIKFPVYEHTELVHQMPIPLAETEKNISLYLHMLHDELSKLQSSKAIPVDIWEKYFEITKNMVMKWDDDNRHRLPMARQDKSIFVSLGTYRGI